MAGAICLELPSCRTARNGFKPRDETLITNGLETKSKVPLSALEIAKPLLLIETAHGRKALASLGGNPSHKPLVFAGLDDVSRETLDEIVFPGFALACNEPDGATWKVLSTTPVTDDGKLGDLRSRAAHPVGIVINEIMAHSEGGRTLLELFGVWQGYRSWRIARQKGAIFLLRPALLFKQEFTGAARGFDDRLDERDTQFPFFEFEDAVDCAASWRSDCVL